MAFVTARVGADRTVLFAGRHKLAIITSDQVTLFGGFLRGQIPMPRELHVARNAPMEWSFKLHLINHLQ